MQYRNLGFTGLRVSVAGLGCNNFGGRIDQAGTDAVVGAALDAGINFFDTARIYGGGESEVMLGKALGSRREAAVVATKFGMERDQPDVGGSRRYILRTVETSLRALGTDFIDLFQIHQPDPATPIDETLDALDTLVTQGKVRYIGCSNFAGWQIADADWTARTQGFRRFATVQNEWSLLSRDIETEAVPAAERFGLGILPYFPLSSGLLTGKVSRGVDAPSDSRLSSKRFGPLLSDANFDKVEALSAWGAGSGRSLLEVALSFLASQPVVSSVIAGATRPEQVQANAAATRTDLTADELAELRALVSAPTPMG
jgi:aryl-alcohol dehydrogenase-like predicted oxidoreductase